MAIFKRKHEFRPDKTHSGMLSKLYLTKKQRLTLGRWLLMTLVLVAVSVIQDVIFSQIRIFGATTDLLSCAILLVCILYDPEIGSVFVLVSSALYWFSGSAPGPYVIAMLTVIGIIVSIFRHSFLREGFGGVFLCTAAAVMVYELCLFAIGLFLNHTTVRRLTGFCITGALSVAAVPLMYPVFSAISKIGGNTWKE